MQIDGAFQRFSFNLIFRTYNVVNNIVYAIDLKTAAYALN